jgi:hypothetical protein
LLEDHDQAVLLFLDARIPPSKQQDLLNVFAHQAGAAWPAVCLSSNLNEIRAKSPILLLSLLAYTVTQETQCIALDVHDELVREIMFVLGDEVIGRGQRSIEIVQALLVATFWNKTTRKGEQGSCFQLLQLAVDMAVDIGIAGSSLQPSPVAYFCRHEDSTSLNARRTWLACFVALTQASLSMRRPHTVPWNEYHQECLLHLEHNGNPSDILFCQIVRITQLIQETSSQLGLCQISTFVDGNDYNSYGTIAMLKHKLEAWVAQIPSYLTSSPTLKVWGHVAMIHIHELALHTPTNKASFAAPFIPGRIAVTDFPKPVNVIPPLGMSLEIIVQSCHAVIETVSNMDPALVLGLPSFCFAPTVLYSLFILVTVLVASTDPANTYGQFVRRDSLRIEECGAKLRTLTTSLKSIDPLFSCFTTRMIDATGWLEQWYNDYIAILQRYEANFSN